MKREDYYIGIDAGTNSVGWAVTDEEYKLIKKNGKTLWGVRLFEEASTAEKRRLARVARRNGDRRAFRQSLLRELFSEEIAKIDPAFYLRLDESKFWEDDKRVPSRYCLFADQNFNDRDYHKQYPTIYHLRNELMHSTESHDIRLLYLAIAHLIKHRGHFLLQMSVTDSQPNFELAWNTFVEDIQDQMGLEVVCTDMNQLKETLCEKLPVREKQKRLKQCIQVSNFADGCTFTCIYDLLSGKITDVSKSFGITLEGEDKGALKVSFAGEDMSDEEKLSTYQMFLEDKLTILLDLKAIYNWGILVGILQGSATISAAKIASYEKHGDDLKKLQRCIKSEFPDKYSEVFRQMKKTLNNYCAYTGHFDQKNSRYKKAAFRCNRDDFYKYLRTLLKDSKTDVGNEILKEMEIGTFLPLQHDKENSVIPYQMNLRELQMILSHAAIYCPFLQTKDAEGISVQDKIESLLTFRVPYYVGPMDHTSAKEGLHWAIKKNESSRVYPWNFEKVIDREACAEAFMAQLTNTCTYLIGESVLPKDSVAYSHFMALNELNNVTVFGEKLPVAVKQRAFEQLFLKYPQVRRKHLENFLIAEGLIKKGETDAIGGLDGDFKASLKVEIKLRDIFREALPSNAQMDEMILSVLLLKQEPDMLKSRIGRIYPHATEGQIKRVSKLPCSGWGRLSSKFLCDLKADLPENTDGPCSLLDALWNTQMNLMQLLANHMPYKKLIDTHNNEMFQDSGLNYHTVEKLSVPPAVRRTVWQTLKIVKEITHIMGESPKKIFVEMAKGSDGSGRTVSRKYQLLTCYQNMGEEGAVWADSIENYDDPRLRQDKLYLYFTQMGRCMYTGEHIDLAALLNDSGNQIYDIDHIYPRSKVKDDSLDNRILVLKSANQQKGDQYPIQGEIRKKQFAFWSYLHQHKLISKKKLDRLNRGTTFTEEELAGFISRQLVETRQSTKLMAQILSQALPKSRIVYVKAGNVSSFRQNFDLVKVRDLNDLHHAKDAYLNIVVGNVYDVKFTADPRNFLRSGEAYSMKTEVLFKYSVKRGNSIAWHEHSIDTVKHNYRRNNIMVTRMAMRRSSGQNGGFYDQNPVRGGTIPLKGDPRLANTKRYGGYNGDTGAYMFLVEHQKGKKRVRSLEPMYLRFAKQVDDDPAKLEVYCKEELKLIEPKVIIPEIQFNTLMEMKGFRFWLTGRSGTAQVVGIQAFQLVLTPEMESYLKRVLRVCERLKAARGALSISEKNDRVSAAQNLQLYDTFLQKMNIPSYSVRPSSQYHTIADARDQFNKLSLLDQCVALADILALFRGNGKTDLSILGAAKTAGTILFSRNITEGFDIIYESVTGFYSHEDPRLQT